MNIGNKAGFRIAPRLASALAANPFTFNKQLKPPGRNNAFFLIDTDIDTCFPLETDANGKSNLADQKKGKNTAMAVPQVDKLTLKELLELRTRVEKAIVTAQERERANLRAKFESMASEAGFGLSDLIGGRSTKGKPVAAKYMNPDNPSETWSGRGRKPKWLAAKLEKGKKQSDFAI